MAPAPHARLSTAEAKCCCALTMLVMVSPYRKLAFRKVDYPYEADTKRRPWVPEPCMPERTLHDSLPSRRDFAPCLDRAGRFVEDPFSQLIEAGPEPRLGAITVGLPADFASPDKDRGGLAGPGDSERHQRKKGVELGGDDEARVLEVEPAGLGVAEEALDGPAFLVRV